MPFKVPCSKAVVQKPCSPKLTRQKVPGYLLDGRAISAGLPAPWPSTKHCTGGPGGPGEPGSPLGGHLEPLIGRDFSRCSQRRKHILINACLQVLSLQPSPRHSVAPQFLLHNPPAPSPQLCIATSESFFIRDCNWYPPSLHLPHTQQSLSTLDTTLSDRQPSDLARPTATLCTPPPASASYLHPRRQQPSCPPSARVSPVTPHRPPPPTAISRVHTNFSTVLTRDLGQSQIFATPHTIHLPFHRVRALPVPCRRPLYNYIRFCVRTRSTQRAACAPGPTESLLNVQ